MDTAKSMALILNFRQSNAISCDLVGVLAGFQSALILSSLTRLFSVISPVTYCSLALIEEGEEELVVQLLGVVSPS